MTHLAIVAFPALDESDRRWIESLRVDHDPLAARIAAHFTFVFPTMADHEAVAAHANGVCAAAAAIPFTITRAEAVRDDSREGGLVFLLPDFGGEEIAALHERLYEGNLRDRRRAGVSFVPHITVAAHPDFERCAALAKEITGAGRHIEGRIDELHLIDLEPERVRSLLTLPLRERNGES
jgi:2'-5' RNA ligase